MPTHRPRYWLPLLAILIGLAGYYGPWVPHKAAGLVVTGLDLAEYVKFLPQVRSGEIKLPREVFYLPLLAASVGAALAAGRRTLPVWLRALCGLLAVPLALAMLPPAWGRQTFADPEFRLQITAILVCLALLPGIVLTRYVPDRLVLALLSLMAVAAAIVPFSSFIQVHPAIAALYRRPLPIGWGAWLELAGFLLAAVLALGEALRPSRLRK